MPAKKQHGRKRQRAGRKPKRKGPRKNNDHHRKRRAVRTHTERLKVVMDTMLNRQKQNKIYGDCYANAAHLYHTIKLEKLGDPEFVVGWVLNKHDRKSESSGHDYIYKQRQLRGLDYSHIDKKEPVFSFGGHCWIEMDGKVLDASYEWNGTGSTYFRDYNHVLEEIGDVMTIQDRFGQLLAANDFLNAWKKLKDAVAEIPEYKDYSQAQKSECLFEHEK